MKTPLQKRKMKQLFPTAASPANTILNVLSGAPVGSCSPNVTGLTGTSIEFPGEMSLLPMSGVFGVGHNDALQSNSST
jgi:hypothetical protein